MTKNDKDPGGLLPGDPTDHTRTEVMVNHHFDLNTMIPWPQRLWRKAKEAVEHVLSPILRWHEQRQALQREMAEAAEHTEKMVVAPRASPVSTSVKPVEVLKSAQGSTVDLKALEEKQANTNTLAVDAHILLTRLQERLYLVEGRLRDLQTTTARSEKTELVPRKAEEFQKLSAEAAAILAEMKEYAQGVMEECRLYLQRAEEMRAEIVRSGEKAGIELSAKMAELSNVHEEILQSSKMLVTHSAGMKEFGSKVMRQAADLETVLQHAQAMEEALTTRIEEANRQEVALRDMKPMAAQSKLEPAPSKVEQRPQQPEPQSQQLGRWNDATEDEPTREAPLPDIVSRVTPQASDAGSKAPEVSTEKPAAAQHAEALQSADLEAEFARRQAVNDPLDDMEMTGAGLPPLISPSAKRKIAAGLAFGVPALMMMYIVLGTAVPSILWAKMNGRKWTPPKSEASQTPNQASMAPTETKANPAPAAKQTPAPAKPSVPAPAPVQTKPKATPPTSKSQSKDKAEVPEDTSLAMRTKSKSQEDKAPKSGKYSDQVRNVIMQAMESDDDEPDQYPSSPPPLPKIKPLQETLGRPEGVTLNPPAFTVQADLREYKRRGNTEYLCKQNSDGTEVCKRVKK